MLACFVEPITQRGWWPKALQYIKYWSGTLPYTLEQWSWHLGVFDRACNIKFHPVVVLTSLDYSLFKACGFAASLERFDFLLQLLKFLQKWLCALSLNVHKTLNNERHPINEILFQLCASAVQDSYTKVAALTVWNSRMHSCLYGKLRTQAVAFLSGHLDWIERYQGVVVRSSPLAFPG